MRKIMFLLVCCVLWLSVSWAQKTFNGRVIGPDGLGLPGVSVVEKGKNINGTSTDIDGNWTLIVPNGNTLIEFTSVGMKTVEIAAQNAQKVKMKEDTQMLGEVEVVAIAYGTAKKESLVGAQSSVSSDQIQKRPITNVTSALIGAAPGVQVLTSGGQPGSGSDIMIRGFGSMNASSSPLYIVDGSPYGGSISNIATSDIESVSILKDAASTAIYGSSAGNGVVLITTKSGKRKNGKPTFNFTMNEGVSKRGVEEYEKIGTMDHFTTRWQQWYNQEKYSNGQSDEYAAAMAARSLVDDLVFNPYAGIKSYYELYNEGGENKFRITDNPTGALSDRWLAIVMPDGTLNPEVTGLLYGDDLDWEDALLRIGHRSEYSLAGSYRTDKFRSFISFGYLNEDGYRIETGLERFTGRVNLGYKANEYISLGSNISYSTANSDKVRGSSGIGFISEMAPIYPIHKHNDDGTYVLDEEGNKLYERGGIRPYNGRYNPVERAYLDLNNTRSDQLTSRSYVKINILPNLHFTTNVAYDLYSSMSKTRYNNIQGKYAGEGFLVMENYRSTTLTWNQLLEYQKDFGKHHFNFLLGHESYKDHTNSREMSKKGIQLEGIDEMSNLTDVDDMSSGTGNYRKEGYFGRVTYDLDSKYNFSASIRRDGTSRLHPDYRWGNFWSVGAGWHLKRENFLKNVDWLDMLKLRLSIGQTGNDYFLSGGYANNYAYQTLYSIGNNNNDRLGLRLRSYAFEALKWETQTSSDIAIEFGMFNRLRGTIELFNKESKDLIFSYRLPASTGIGSMDKNLGKMRNYGLEASLKFAIIRNVTTNWSLNINGTHLRNKIVTLPEENRKEGIESGTKKYLEGKSKYEFYLKEWIGVDPQDGLAIYRLDKEKYPDKEGLETTGEKSTWTKEGKFAKKHFCGSSIPKIYGGFGTDFRWKNIDLSANFAYQLGGKVYDSGYQGLMGRSMASGLAMHKDMLKAWKKPGDITEVPRLDAGTAGEYDASTSDRFLISSNALMFKSISLGYTLPEEWTSRAKLSNVRFSISAENLFLLSKRQGLDPMGSYKGIYDGSGYNYQKTIVGSLSFSF